MTNRDELREQIATMIVNRDRFDDTAGAILDAILPERPHPIDDPRQQRSIRQAEVALTTIVRRASVCDACGRLLSEEGCEYRQGWGEKVHTIVGGMRSRSR